MVGCGRLHLRCLLGPEAERWHALLQDLPDAHGGELGAALVLGALWALAAPTAAAAAGRAGACVGRAAGPVGGRGGALLGLGGNDGHGLAVGQRGDGGDGGFPQVGRLGLEGGDVARR